MRDYFSTGNLARAIAIAAAATLMSVPRIVLGGTDPALLVPAAFLSMVFVCGAATAWSGRGGMSGLFPRPLRIAATLAPPAALAAVLVPLYAVFLDPVLRSVLAASVDDRAFSLMYPATAGAWIAAVLWSAGFETLLFQAAPMSVLSRVTGDWRAALVLTVATRLYVLGRQLASLGVTDSVPVFAAGAAATTALGCILFARGGILPAACLAAALDLHLLFGPGR